MRQVLVGLSFLLAFFVISTVSHADDWNDIDCGVSKLAVPGFSDLKCQRGPDKSNMGCVVQKYFVQSDVGDFILQLNIVGRNCSLSPIEDVETQVKTFLVQSGASGWGPMHDVAGASGAHMTRYGHNCFSFYKPGPSQSGSWGYGVAWHLFGVYCAAANKNLDDRMVGNFINSIEIK